MKRSLAIVATLVATSILGACVSYVPSPEPPAGVAVIAPTYASPGPGWAWRYHARYGWGWYNPHVGWHRGWR